MGNESVFYSVFSKSLFMFVFALALGAVFSARAEMSAEEAELRRALDIPAEAKEVIIFAQSSHVDPNWLKTADEYQKTTDENFDRALAELKKDPRYVYSVECLFFFKRYWQDHPQNQELLRQYVNQGRIRFTGTGLTTPDTLLPEPENLVRDYLFGLTWLRQHGMNPEPKLAYFPDCFGHNPALPAILRELGYKYTAFARIDGMYFIATDYRPRREYPRPGSSAELLMKKHQSLDFVWKAGDGAQVLAHWCAFTYLQGDMIDYSGITYVSNLHVGLPARSPRQTNAKIDAYIRELKPLSKTGYMFCPIGGDFNNPIPDLPRILDTYNRERYPVTGVYAVLAGLEDYMKLVDCHRAELPVLELDPNPYWTGFYSSRPELKQVCRKLSRSLVLAEGLGVWAEERGYAGSYPDLAWPWEISLFSNHHDFITGTARERVYRREQLPLLKKAHSEVDAVISSLVGKLKPAGGVKPPPLQAQITHAGQEVVVENEFYRVELDARAGGCITRWYDKALKKEMLTGPSNDVALYEDDGGLWVMGQELYKGKLKPRGQISSRPARLEVEEKEGALVIKAFSELEGRPFLRELFFRADEPVIRMRLTGSVRSHRVATVLFRTSVSPEGLVQEVPFGVVKRPLQKLHEPTFWSVKNWVELVDRSQSFGVNAALTAPAAVHANEKGELELIALRFACVEKSRRIPVLSFVVATSNDSEPHEFEYALWSHGSGDWLSRRVFATARKTMAEPWLSPTRPDLETLAFSLVELDREDVVVSAIKRAEKGEGIVVRLFRYAPAAVTVRLSWKGRPVKEAFLTDGLERIKAPLKIQEGKVELPMQYSLATLLLQF